MPELNELTLAAPESQKTFKNLCNKYEITEFPAVYCAEEALEDTQILRTLVLDLSRHIPYAFKYPDELIKMLDMAKYSFFTFTDGALELLVPSTDDGKDMHTFDTDIKNKTSFMIRNVFNKAYIKEGTTHKEFMTLIKGPISTTRTTAIIALFKDEYNIQVTPKDVYPYYIDKMLSLVLRIHTLPLIAKD